MTADEQWSLSLGSLHLAAMVAGLLIYVTTTQGLRQRRHPSAAVAWVLMIVLLPYLGVPLFLLFGSRKLGKPGQGFVTETAPAGVRGDRFQALARALRLPPPAGFAAAHVHEDGDAALAALLRVIDGAQHTLHVGTFLIGNDSVARRLAGHLAARARDGIEVRVLVDGIGALAGRETLRQLRESGVDVTLFVPPWWSPLRGRTNLRNHRKMAVADRSRAWFGGRNLAGEYFSGIGVDQPWIDLTVDVEGPLAASLDELFEADWRFARRGRDDPSLRPALPVPAADPGRVPAQLIPSGPDHAEDTLYTLLISSIFDARERIDLVTPYFVPDEALAGALHIAARRGVRVRLILPRRSNHRLADWARQRSLRDAETAGVTIEMLPAMMHAKAVLVDDELAFVGSANLDARSLFLNYELMVAFRDAPTVGQLRAWVDARRQQAVLWQPQPPAWWRDLWEGLVRWLTFQL
ncbi:MAG: phospholipase D-like domain-containing protein [Burkholderiaceae bacterium]